MAGRGWNWGAAGGPSVVVYPDKPAREVWGARRPFGRGSRFRGFVWGNASDTSGGRVGALGAFVVEVVALHSPTVEVALDVNVTCCVAVSEVGTTDEVAVPGVFASYALTTAVSLAGTVTVLLRVWAMAELRP